MKDFGIQAFIDDCIQQMHEFGSGSPGVTETEKETDRRPSAWFKPEFRVLPEKRPEFGKDGIAFEKDIPAWERRFVLLSHNMVALVSEAKVPHTYAEFLRKCIFLFIFANKRIRMAKPLRRYLWLIETVSRAGNISYDEIRRMWLNSPVNDLGETDYPKRTFLSHIEEIKELFGVSILCDRKNDYKYYIAEEDVQPKRNELIGTMSLSIKLLEDQALRKRVRISSFAFSNQFLPAFLDALTLCKLVELTVPYLAGETDREIEESKVRTSEKGASAEKPRPFLFLPYFLDFCYHTWFVLGYVPERQEMEVFRVADIISLDIPDTPPVKRNDTLTFEDVRLCVLGNETPGYPPRSIWDHRCEYYYNFIR